MRRLHKFRRFHEQFYDNKKRQQSGYASKIGGCLEQYTYIIFLNDVDRFSWTEVFILAQFAKIF